MYSGYKSSVIYVLWTFFPVCGLPFYFFFLNGIFRRTRSFFLVKLKLSMFFFMIHASCVLSKKLFSTSASSGSFVVLSFAVRIVIDVQLIFVCNMRYEFIFIFFHMDVQFFQSFNDWKILAFVEETFLSPLNYLDTFVTGQLATYLWVYFRTSFCMSPLTLIPHFLNYCNLTVSVEIRQGKSS